MLTRPTPGASALRAQLPVDLPHEPPLAWFIIPPFCFLNPLRGFMAEGAGLISAFSLHPSGASLCFVCAAPRRSNCVHHPAVLLYESALRIYGGRGGIRTRGRLPYVRFRVECLKPDSATLPCRRSKSLRNMLLYSQFTCRLLHPQEKSTISRLAIARGSGLMIDCSFGERAS